VVIARLKINEFGEMREFCFSGEVYFEPQFKSYIIKYAKPGDKKMVVFNTGRCMGDMTFGSSHNLGVRMLQSDVIEYIERFAWKNYKTEKE
jgi:hypothetical protein